jgi:glycosyltransferase involved in cell wall biosynthesis
MIDRDKTSQVVRVLYVHPSDDLYGADRILLQIVKGLDRARFEPIVVLPSDSAHIGLLSEELKMASIECIHMPLAVLRRRYFTPRHLPAFLWNMVRGTWQLFSLIRSRNVKVVHSSTLAVLSGSFAARAAGRPHLWHVHEILVRPNVIRKFVHGLLVPFAHKVVCVSNAVQRHILEDQPAAATCVLHNGIELWASSSSSEELSAELGLQKDLPVVGMIGRVSAWKGQELFAQAAAILKGRGVPMQCVAIGGVFDGDTTHLNRLIALIRDLGIEDVFQLHGFRKNARDFLKTFDIFVLPSTLPDPFPTVVLEAMSQSRPVVAAAHGGSIEMVIEQPDAKETGILFRPNDAEALANAIATLLQNSVRRVNMGVAGRRRLIDMFELRAYMTRLMQTYDDMVVVSRRSCIPCDGTAAQ